MPAFISLPLVPPASPAGGLVRQGNPHAGRTIGCRMGVAESCTAESWEESEWDREQHGAYPPLERPRPRGPGRRAIAAAPNRYRDLPAGRHGRAVHGGSAPESRCGARRPRRSCHLERPRPREHGAAVSAAAPALKARHIPARGEAPGRAAHHQLSPEVATQRRPDGHVTRSDTAGGATKPAGGRRARKSESRATLPRGRDFKSVADAWHGCP
jgi:hypothetical protein